MTEENANRILESLYSLHAAMAVNGSSETRTKMIADIRALEDLTLMSDLQQQCRDYRHKKIQGAGRVEIIKPMYDAVRGLDHSVCTQDDKQNAADLAIELFHFADRIGFDLIDATIARLAELKAEDN